MVAPDAQFDSESARTTAASLKFWVARLLVTTESVWKIGIGSTPYRAPRWAAPDRARLILALGLGGSSAQQLHDYHDHQQDAHELDGERLKKVICRPPVLNYGMPGKCLSGGLCGYLRD